MFKRLVIVQILLLSFQVILYFGSEKFQKNPHNVKRKIDDHIPFIPWTVSIYCLWFFLIALFPIALYYENVLYYQKYFSVMLLEILLSTTIYLIYPTTFERPVPPDTFWGKFMKMIYKGSYRGLNCAPSLHCSSCFLVMYISISKISFTLSIISFVIAFAIVISTLTTKQHVVIDVVSAFFLFLICLAIFEILPKGLASLIMDFISGKI